MLPPKLLLASSSPYRKQLLARLDLAFDTASPDIDETPIPGEAAEALAVRLAESKAKALAPRFPDHIIIGSDQVAALPDGSLLSKPGQPYDCAGSFKMEGLGIALFSRLQGDDPNSLIGLPLIALTRILRELGINPLLD